MNQPASPVFVQGFMAGMFEAQRICTEEIAAMLMDEENQQTPGLYEHERFALKVLRRRFGEAKPPAVQPYNPDTETPDQYKDGTA